MKQYYILDEGKQKGPLSLEELLKIGITAETLVWHADLESWKPAKNLDELKIIFTRQTPPPVIQQVAPPIYPNSPPIQLAQKVKSKSRTRFLLMALVTLIVIYALVTINKRSGHTSPSLNYLENKISIEDHERANPQQFLDATGTYNETVFGNKMRIKGTVTNRATVANYKDIIIEVSYFSATQTLINKERFVLYEFVPAHSKKSFEWRIKPPSGTNTIGWDAVGGVGY